MVEHTHRATYHGTVAAFFWVAQNGGLVGLARHGIEQPSQHGQLPTPPFLVLAIPVEMPILARAQPINVFLIPLGEHLGFLPFHPKP